MEPIRQLFYEDKLFEEAEENAPLAAAEAAVELPATTPGGVVPEALVAGP